MLSFIFSARGPVCIFTPLKSPPNAAPISFCVSFERELTWSLPGSSSAWLRSAFGVKNCSSLFFLKNGDACSGSVFFLNNNGRLMLLVFFVPQKQSNMFPYHHTIIQTDLYAGSKTL